MELAFKPDFEDSRCRWDAFWKGENSRPLLAATLPRPGIEPVEKPRYGAGYDGNFTPVIDQLLRWAESHEFLGDAIPFFYLEFGADHFATLLGADMVFPYEGRDAGWAVPFVKDWDAVELRFRRDSRWWEQTVRFAEALRARCEGALLIAAPTMVANLDALAAVRGPQNLLLDLVLCPEAVQRALAQVNAAHAEILQALGELLEFDRYGSINRHGMYSRGRINVPQCDFSCMISPAMFREFAIPALAQEMARLDAVEYHLDGPDALRHLEALCALDKLDVIQWVPGAGAPSQQDWNWLYQKIDTLGKGQFRWADSKTVKRVWRNCQVRKQFFTVSVSSRAEFETLCKEIELEK